MGSDRNSDWRAAQISQFIVFLALAGAVANVIEPCVG